MQAIKAAVAVSQQQSIKASQKAALPAPAPISRRNLFLGVLSIASISGVNREAVAEPEKLTPAMRKARLAAKKAAAGQKTDKKAETGSLPGAVPELPKNVGRQEELLSGRQARKAAMKAKAEKIRNGGTPTF